MAFKLQAVKVIEDQSPDIGKPVPPSSSALGHKRFLLNLKMEQSWQRDCAHLGEAQADMADDNMGIYSPPLRLYSTLR